MSGHTPGDILSLYSSGSASILSHFLRSVAFEAQDVGCLAVCMILLMTNLSSTPLGRLGTCAKLLPGHRIGYIGHPQPSVGAGGNSYASPSRILIPGQPAPLVRFDIGAISLCLRGKNRMANLIDGL